MNNFRLSNHSGNIPTITEEVKNATPICEPLPDGRLWNLTAQQLDVPIKGGYIF